MDDGARRAAFVSCCVCWVDVCDIDIPASLFIGNGGQNLTNPVGALATVARRLVIRIPYSSAVQRCVERRRTGAFEQGAALTGRGTFAASPEEGSAAPKWARRRAEPHLQASTHFAVIFWLSLTAGPLLVSSTSELPL